MMAHDLTLAECPHGVVLAVECRQCEDAKRAWPRVGDTITLFCTVPIYSRPGAARQQVAAGTSGVVEYAYPSHDVFEVRFGTRVVTVARIEFTPH